MKTTIIITIIIIICLMQAYIQQIVTRIYLAANRIIITKNRFRMT